MSGGEIRNVKTTFKRFHRNNELQRDDLRSHISRSVCIWWLRHYQHPGFRVWTGFTLLEPHWWVRLWAGRPESTKVKSCRITADGFWHWIIQPSWDVWWRKHGNLSTFLFRRCVKTPNCQTLHCLEDNSTRSNTTAGGGNRGRRRRGRK